MDAFAIYGIKSETIINYLKDSRIDKDMKQKMKHAKLHARVEVISSKLSTDFEHLKNSMEDAKDMIY